MIVRPRLFAWAMLAVVISGNWTAIVANYRGLFAALAPLVFGVFSVSLMILSIDSGKTKRTPRNLEYSDAFKVARDKSPEDQK